MPHAGPAPPTLSRRDRANHAWWTALIGLCLALAVPLFMVDVPPLLDYPNHLARAFVLASLPHDPSIARFYAANWSVIPNLAFDLVAPPLMAVLPVHVVGRLLVATSVLLPVLGSVAYNMAQTARWPHDAASLNPRALPTRKPPDAGCGHPAHTSADGRWWSLGSGLVAYNGCLLYGFLNFQVSLGVALLLGAGWVRWRERRPSRAIAMAMAGALALFACHLMGLVFFLLLIGGDDLFYLSKTAVPGLWNAALRRGAALLLVLAAPALLYAVSSLGSLGGDAQFMPIGDKLMQLTTVFVNYAGPLDLATTLLLIALPVIALLLGRGRAVGSAGVVMALLLATFFATPYAWKGTYFLDTRFAIMLGFMVFAGFAPARWPTGLRRLVGTALALLFATRMAVLTVAWAARASDIADLRSVLAVVQPGQALYVAEAGVDEAPAYWAGNPGWRLLSSGMRTDEHLAALALIERRAYWPFEFDMPSQQPIRTLEPYRTLANRVGHLPNRAEAAAADVCGFDYVLLMDADAVPALPASRFRLLAGSSYAALYGIIDCKAK